jgi:hypothetical protein
MKASYTHVFSLGVFSHTQDVVELGECCSELGSTSETILEHWDDIPVNSLHLLIGPEGFGLQNAFE